ncbi:hypothetical protein KY285_004934 [Solanum tuberosum]|nr:hypothetical protein KY285_004934 [Solanum tuberosum]
MENNTMEIEIHTTTVELGTLTVIADSNQTSYCGVRFLISYLKDYIFMLPPRQSFLWILQEEKHCASILISPFQQFHVQFPVLMSWISVERNILTLHMAYIMDTNEEERVKGITVEVGRAPFEIETTRFTILDALVSSEHSLTKEIV